MLSKPATMLLGLIYEKPLNAYEIIKHLNYMKVKGWVNIAAAAVDVIKCRVFMLAVNTVP